MSTPPQNYSRSRLPQSQPMLLKICQGLGWIGSLSLVSAGFAVAEDQIPSMEIPGAAELLQVEIAPEPIEPAPVVAPEPVEPPVAPIVEAPIYEAAPIEPAIAETAPADTPESVAPPEVFSNRSNISIQHSDVFIDPTDYSLGATQPTGPDSLVLSERSTGCQRVIRTGQAIPGSICPPPEPVATIAEPPASGAYSSSYAAAPVSSSSSSAGQGGSNYGVVESVVGRTTAAGREFYNRSARILNQMRRGEFKFVFPITIPAPITSAFGWRIHPISGDQRFHAGTDIGAPLGTPVVAVQAGRVAVSEFLRGYGKTVVLEHEDGTKTVMAQSLYAHMSELLVQPGDWIEQGEVIGLVGSTGNSTGPHLHFEFQQLTADGWVLVDPGQLLEYALAQLVETLRLAQANPQAAQPNTTAQPSTIAN